ncbi:MAG TPA: flagellar basal body P-ring protein FlgI [Steroidobacteraceae bacterium]|nr:flagellar basal body P-ring protein FlgI [Steroidobacteraceae bacterium]
MSTSSKSGLCAVISVVLAGIVLCMPAAAAVRLRDLVRVAGAQETMVLGYGLVVGLGGTGDSPQSAATNQTMSNLLRQFGLQVSPTAVSSRNVGVVLVTATLPPLARTGDHLDVNVASAGDATSLAGGTLLLTQLIGADRVPYAVAQGPLSVGGFRYEQAGSMTQKNNVTSGLIPGGAIVEQTITPVPLHPDGTVDLILKEPDYVTAERIAETIDQADPAAAATTVNAGRVRLHPGNIDDASLVRMMAAIDDLSVEPSIEARVVVNERTGTVVSGGDVWVSPVTVAQGDIEVAITQRNYISQPDGTYFGASPGISTVVVPEAKIDTHESRVRTLSMQGATIAQLIMGLQSIHASSRDVIAILQGIKRAGALHADLIIQ